MSNQNDNKAIEEMANIINEMTERNAHYYVKENGKTIQKEAFADCFAIAEALYNAGYKQEKETAREILQEVDKELYETSKLYLEAVLKDGKDYNSINKYGVMQIAHEIVKKIAKRNGVEVE